jgi:hypothetical protein
MIYTASMWRIVKNLFKSNNETCFVVDNVDKIAISKAYKSVEQDIESLRKYDNGEKTINAPDLKTVVRNVR